MGTYINNPASNRSRRVSTNLSEEEYAVLCLKKQEANIGKMADFIRLMILGQDQYPVLNVPEVNEEIYQHLIRTTSNLNQLVHLMQQNGASDKYISNALAERNSLSKTMRELLSVLAGDIEPSILRSIAAHRLSKADLEKAIRTRESLGWE